MALDASNTSDAGVTNEALLVLFANGDHDAARTLTVRLTPIVLNHAMRLLGDRAEAEDVAQDAMMRLWKIAREWRQDEAKVTTWLYRVTANLCTDRLRRRRSAALDEVPEPEDGRPSATETLQDAARAQALQSALMALPDRQRQAVILRHIEGKTNPEIAEVLEISVEAVESLTARGKRALASLLAGRKEELGFTDE